MPPPILFGLTYVVVLEKLSDAYFFLRAQNGFEGVKTTPEKCGTKYPFNCSTYNNRIFHNQTNLNNILTIKDEKFYFVNLIKNMEQYGTQNVYNSDQCGFQLEMHSRSTLAIEVTRQVECFVQSISSITHSYTIKPTIFADGKLQSPLYLVLKETRGKFRPILQETIYQPINAFVAASESGKLTSGKFVYF